MYKIGICDDEQIILQKLCSYVTEVLSEENIEHEIHAFEQSVELLQTLEKEKIDILLLDIDLPGINGMEIASRLKCLPYTPLLIFVTCQESFVYESFQYQPFDFIRKSCYERDLRVALQRGIAQLVEQKKDYVLEQPGGVVRLQLRDILYFESCANYIKVVTQKESFQQRKNLHQVEAELSSHGFVRIHKGYLVNQEAVYILKSDRVIMISMDELPIGRHYSAIAKGKILGYLRG
uniref:LytR/AlgR family response regulator transcription factor n=1 Tax=Acetatifactor sp. TaxID=1872090 RepID=UPI0040574500